MTSFPDPLQRRLQAASKHGVFVKAGSPDVNLCRSPYLIDSFVLSAVIDCDMVLVMNREEAETIIPMRREKDHAATNKESNSDGIFTVHTSLLFDSASKIYFGNVSIDVNPKTGLVVDVYRRNGPLPDVIHSPDIDLRGKTVVPGFVDAHAHIFLHPYSETSSINQERDESIVERIIRATNNCRDALKAGFTTYRDLGTEGASDADIGVRDAINRGLIPGPRLFVATDPLASSGSYAIRQENRLGGTVVPRLSDPCDGVDGVRAAVRRRLGAGADIIKFYADYRRRALRFPEAAWPGQKPIMHAPDGHLMFGGRNPNLVNFTQEEMNTIVAEATVGRAPVAAHAQDPQAVIMAAKAGVTSIEHGFVPSDEALETMKENNTIFVPTLRIFEAYKDMFEDGEYARVLDRTRQAWKMGIRLACGGDTGAVAHGENAREIELMVEAEIPVNEVLRAATLGGWEACGGDWCGRRFGRIWKGWAADIVALEGDIREDFGAIRKVGLVMKDGAVVVAKGQILQ